MAHNHQQTKAEYNLAVLDEFRALHPNERDWTMEDAAAWALRNGKWHAPTRSAIKLCAAEFAKAAREEFTTDPQGRRVRKKHARREFKMVDGRLKQLVFWEDITNATPTHMRVSLQQRRTAILADNAQLKRDRDSYNDNNPHGAQIQMSFDYAEDLLELEAPEHYGEDLDTDEDDEGDPLPV